MTQMTTKAKKKQHGSLRMRTILLIIQIFLPFGLFVALQWENPLGAMLIAGAITVSVGVLVWMG